MDPFDYAFIIGPFVLLVLIRMIKDLYREYFRQSQLFDSETKAYPVFRNNTFMEVYRADIQPGELILLSNGDICPVDMFLVTASSDECYVDAFAIFGEFVIDTKVTTREMTQILDINNLEEAYSKLNKFQGHLKMEQPNSDLNTFRGSLSLDGFPSDCVLGIQNLILSESEITGAE